MTFIDNNFIENGTLNTTVCKPYLISYIMHQLGQINNFT